MTLVFILGLALICIFSLSVAGYFIYFKTHIGSSIAKAALTFVLGLVVFVVTFAISIILVWPPYLWSVLE